MDIKEFQGLFGGITAFE